MNIIAGDLFTHLSVVIENPDTLLEKRILYEQALSRLQKAHYMRSGAGGSVPLTGNELTSLGLVFVNIFCLEALPDDEEGPLTDDPVCR